MKKPSLHQADGEKNMWRSVGICVPRKWEEELECMEKVIAWLEEGKDQHGFRREHFAIFVVQYSGK